MTRRPLALRGARAAIIDGTPDRDPTGTSSAPNSAPDTTSIIALDYP